MHSVRPDYVIKKAVLSEKSLLLSQKKIYTLEVDIKATKLEVKKALKDVFGVDVVGINTSVLRGKMARKARARTGKNGAVTVKLPNVKKAFVRLKDGQELPTPTEVVAKE